MTFEEHKEKKYRAGNSFADYEYVGKRSRQPWRGLVIAIAISLLFGYMAWDRWHEINAAEETGATVYMTSIEWGLYKITGKAGLSGFFALLGAVVLYFGIASYRRLEKIKAS